MPSFYERIPPAQTGTGPLPIQPERPLQKSPKTREKNSVAGPAVPAPEASGRLNPPHSSSGPGCPRPCGSSSPGWRRRWWEAGEWRPLDELHYSSWFPLKARQICRMSPVSTDDRRRRSSAVNEDDEAHRPETISGGFTGTKEN